MTDITEQLADALRDLCELYDAHKRMAYHPLWKNARAALAVYEASKATPKYRSVGVRDEEEWKEVVDAPWPTYPLNAHLQGGGPIGSEPARDQDIEGLVGHVDGILEEMETVRFGCSGKDLRQVNEYFNRRASDARAALLAVQQKLRGGE